ncbi:MAG TPA: sugar phosphate isomerase/epimerase [Phycisphaerae bacterium]|nr:sugar phosphate isomerase/epimerase [Phycisphaerae bacterium]
MAGFTVAMQMYTLRKEAEADYPGTLEQVAKIGYPAAQVSGLYRWKAREIRKVMDDLGLGSAGTHVALEMLEKDFNAAVDMVKDLGTEWAIVPWLGEERRKTAEGWRTLAKIMTGLGAKLAAVGLRLGYHNHSFEFQKFNGQYGYDIFYEAVDPNLVHNEIDTYWVKHGGEDPVKYLKRFAGHIQVVHFKDMGKGPAKPMVPVGEGILDWPAILAACKAGGTEWACIEQDDCAPLEPLAAARVSLENCKKWGLV